MPGPRTGQQKERKKDRIKANPRPRGAKWGADGWPPLSRTKRRNGTKSR